MSRHSGLAQKQVILGTQALLIWFQLLFEAFNSEQLKMLIVLLASQSEGCQKHQLQNYTEIKNK